MNLKSSIAAAAASVMVLSLAACGGSDASDSEKILVSVPGKSIALPSPWIAEAEGYFKERGVDVEIVTVEPGTDLAQLGAGKVDLVLSGLSAGVFNAAESGLDINWVAPAYEVNPESGMGVYLKDEFFDDEGNLVPERLKGAQIAITQSGGLQDHAILTALAGSSVKYDDLRVQRMENVDIFSAIESGRLDGGFLTSPFYANLAPDSGYRLGIKPFLPSFVGYLTGPSTKGKKEALTKFFCAIKDAQSEHLQPGFTQDGDTVTLLSSVLGIPAKKIEAEEAPNLFKSDLSMDGAEEFVQSMQELMIGAGFIEYDEPIAGDQIIDRTFIDASCE